MEGENGEQVEDELHSLTSSADWFMQSWRNETGFFLSTMDLTWDRCSMVA